MGSRASCTLSEMKASARMPGGPDRGALVTVDVDPSSTRGEHSQEFQPRTVARIQGSAALDTHALRRIDHKAPDRAASRNAVVGDARVEQRVGVGVFGAPASRSSRRTSRQGPGPAPHRPRVCAGPLLR